MSRFSKRQLRMPPLAKYILREVAGEHGMDFLELLCYPSRERQYVEARRSACRKLRRSGYSLQSIARWMGLHHTTVLHHTRGIRPDPPDETYEVGGLEIPVPDLSGEWAI